MIEQDKPAQTGLEDTLLRLNLEGTRNVLHKRHRHIDYIMSKCKGYLRGRACDVGIGDGYLLDKLATTGLSTYGMDISRYIMDRLNGHLLACGDISKTRPDIKFGINFEVITCLGIIEHVLDIESAVLNLKNSLVGNGILIVSTVLNENLDNNMTQCPNCQHIFHRIGHQHSFADWQQLLCLFRGFTVIKKGYMPLFIFKTDWLNRIVSWLYSRRTGCSRQVYILLRKENK